MQQGLRNHLLSTGLLVASALSAASNLEAQEPVLPAIPAADTENRETVEDKKETEITLSEDLHRIRERAQSGPIDICSDVLALSARAGEVWGNPMYRGYDYQLFREQANKLAADCMAHYETTDPEELGIVVKNVVTLGSAFRWHDHDFAPITTEGTFANANIEKALKTPTANDALNRARLESTITLMAHYRTNRAKEAVLALVKYPTALKNSNTTSPETHQSLLKSIEEILAIPGDTFINADEQWTSACATLATTMADLLQEQPADRDSLLLAANSFAYFSKINPELRYAQSTSAKDFGRLIDTIDNLYVYAASHSHDLASPEDQSRLRITLLRQFNAMGSMTPAIQTRFIETLHREYLQDHATDPGFFSDFASAFRTRSESDPNFLRSQWSAYAIYSLLDQHQSTFQNAITSIQNRALTATNSEDALTALRELSEVGLFFDRLPHYDYTFSTLKFDEIAMASTRQHQESVAGWVNTAFGARGHTFAREYLNTRGVAFENDRRVLPGEETRFDAPLYIDTILLRAVHRDPGAGKEIFETLRSLVQSSESAADREVHYTLLRAPVVAALLDPSQAPALTQYLRQRIATEESPRALRALGETIGFGFHVECSQIRFNLSEGQHLVNVGFHPVEIQQLFRTESDFLIKLAEYNSNATPLREVQRTSRLESTEFETLLADLVQVASGSLPSSRMFLLPLDITPGASGSVTDDKERAQLGLLRHNACLTLTYSLVSQQQTNYRATMTSLLEDSLTTCGDSKELGARVAALFEVFTTRGGVTLSEHKQVLSERASALRGLLFDGSTEIVHINGVRESFTIPPVVERIIESQAPTVHGLRERNSSQSEEYGKQKYNEQLKFAAGFLDATFHFKEEEKLQFLADLGIQFHSLEDAQRTIDFFETRKLSR